MIQLTQRMRSLLPVYRGKQQNCRDALRTNYFCEQDESLMKKLLLVLGGILLLLLMAALTIPVLYKERIAARAKAEINQAVNAKVDFGTVGLTLIKSFPNITFCMNDFVITGINEFAGDTLAAVSALEIKLRLWDVIGGNKISIQSVSLQKPMINILVLKDGTANYQIMKEDSSATSASSPSSFNAALQAYSIRNGTLRYSDLSLGFKMRLEEVDHSGQGDFTADFFTLITKTTVASTSLWYGGIRYLTDARAVLTAEMDIDLKNYRYTFKNNKLLLNELPLSVDGWLAMPASDIEMDLKWAVKKSEFSPLVSLLPGAYTQDFKDLKSSGTVAMDGYVKGIYGENKMPGFGVNLKIDRGMFQYPSLPSAVKNVNVDLAVKNHDGIPDHTLIDLKKLHVELGDEPFDARLFVSTPVSDANLDGAVKGTINLANIKNFIPQQAGTELNGIVTADVTMKGRYSSIEKKEYSRFNAAGTVELKNMTYRSSGYPPANIAALLLTFNPQTVVLNGLSGKIGRSDFSASGNIDNLLGYYFKEELLTGTFAFNSAILDLNELMTGTATGTTPPDTSSLTVLEVPANIDFTLNSSIAKIYYDNLQLQNFNGLVILRQQTVNLSRLTFNLLNGSAGMSGVYSTANPRRPTFDFNMTLTDFDIQQSFQTFTTAKKLAPVAERCTGKYSTSLSLNGWLSQNMQPELRSLTGKGKLTSNNVQVSNLEPLSQLATALKMEEYKKLELQDLNLSYEFENGRVKVDPFVTRMAGSQATVAGSTGFDQTIDYTVKLEIPKSKIPASAQAMFNTAFANANRSLGTTLELPDPVKVNVRLGGTLTQPTVKTDLGSQGAALAETAKEAVEEKVEETIEEGKEKARAEADKILAEAEKQAKQIQDAAKAQADALRKQGYAAADSLVTKTTNPLAKVAAQEAAKQAKKETDKQVQKILDEANRNAQKILDEANKKSEELLK
jgi:vacuolar-type H+-ATPase subunit H